VPRGELVPKMPPISEALPNTVVPTVAEETLTRELTSISQVVTSRSSLQPLMEKYDLYHEERLRGEPMELLIDQMRKQIKVEVGGLDGIMYDEPDDKIILTNHSRPIGTLTAIDPKTGDIVATVELEDTAPEGAAADGKGHVFVNNESKNTIQVIEAKTMKVLASWPVAPCDGPTGIAYDKASKRIFSGCSGTSVVIDATSGKVVAKITNGEGVDALGWDPAEKLIYIPAGRDGRRASSAAGEPDRVRRSGSSARSR